MKEEKDNQEEHDTDEQEPVKPFGETPGGGVPAPAPLDPVPEPPPPGETSGPGR
jgi:hypothetical protein